MKHRHAAFKVEVLFYLSVSSWLKEKSSAIKHMRSSSL